MTLTDRVANILGRPDDRPNQPIRRLEDVAMTIAVEVDSLLEKINKLDLARAELTHRVKVLEDNSHADS